MSNQKKGKTTELFTESEQFKKMLRKHNLTIDKFTCHGCGSADTCQYAWDLYNTDGDCLGEK